MLVFTGALAAGGSLDPGFGSNGFVITDLGSHSDTGHRLALSSDGSAIFALGSIALNTIRIPAITRYNSDGSLNGQVALGFGELGPCDFAIESDGKMIWAAANSRSEITLARYLSDGVTLDDTFGANGIAIVSFGPSYQIFCSDLAIQPDHKIVAAGSEITGQGDFTNFFIARLNENGVQDFKYILDNYHFPNNRYNYGEAVAIQSDGKIVMSGGMMDNDGEGQISLARLNTDGSMDAAFGSNGKGTVTNQTQ